MIINGNSLEELKKFPDNYFHSVVTDPPYGLSFMGKKWDYDVPSVELWQEVFRVLKEGGYLLSFAGTRTQHRMAVNIEDAGFEIRDMIAWVYGSGFPKSHNIGRAIAKKRGEKVKGEFTTVRGRASVGLKEPTPIKDRYKFRHKTKTEWEGWGTALKPALEPITMARKPFKGTVANNVLTNGVGGINIDGCRVDVGDLEQEPNYRVNAKNHKRQQITDSRFLGDLEQESTKDEWTTKGRFPANFIHDGSDEVTDLFPDTSNSARPHSQGKSYDSILNANVYGKYNPIEHNSMHNDKGSASRFFYCAKASKKDRNEGLEDFEEKPSYMVENGSTGLNTENSDGANRKPRTTTNQNNHPTVKPTDLMRYLVRLVTPKDGIVLDCFMGSGSTGKACALEGFEFVGIDLDKDYCKIAKARIDKAIEDKKQLDAQLKLF
jgi:DNA modification methylase